MKRSEIIKDFSELIMSVEDSWSTYEDRADQYLKFLEDVGMRKCEKRNLGEMGNLWTPEGWESED